MEGRYIYLPSRVSNGAPITVVVCAVVGNFALSHLFHPLLTYEMPSICEPSKKEEHQNAIGQTDTCLHVRGTQNAKQDGERDSRGLSTRPRWYGGVRRRASNVAQRWKSLLPPKPRVFLKVRAAAASRYFLCAFSCVSHTLLEQSGPCHAGFGKGLDGDQQPTWVDSSTEFRLRSCLFFKLFHQFLEQQ